MNPEHIEGVADCIDCGCADCQAALRSFNAYIADVRRRWYNPLPNPLDDFSDPAFNAHPAAMANRTITTCYFGCGNAATTTRTRPDGAVKNCPTCADCADLIDEQNYNEEQAARMDPERVR